MRGGARTELTPAPPPGGLARRWCALGAYVALVYGFLPYGPRVGLAVAATIPGSWLLGPGVQVCTVAGAAIVLALMLLRRAPLWSYAAIVLAAAGYVVAFSWLRSQHLERTHLPEYGIMALLSWRALSPMIRRPLAAYLAAAALAAFIGYGDELLQLIVPGRVYDLRDVAMNATGAILGTLVIAATQAERNDRAASEIPRDLPASDAAGEQAGAGGRAQRL